MKLFFRLTLIIAILNGLAFAPNQELQAQDPRYTQYYQAPLRLNPAMAGVFDGLWRVGVNFRTQWGSIMTAPYMTYALAGEFRIPVFKADYIGVGFSALTDVAGGGMYNVTDINLGATYIKKLTGSKVRSYRPGLTSYLAAGFQLGIGQRSVKWVNLTYSTQYTETENGSYYNQATYSGENSDAMRMTKIYPDLSAGLLWYGVFGERKSIYAGLGLFHLNRPEISLFSRHTTSADIERLYIRVTAHVGGEVLLGKGAALSLLPGFVGMFQGPSMELNMGLGVKYQAPKFDDFALKFSVWTRLANKLLTDIDADALMLLVGIDWQSFQFGISYDINISSLSIATLGQGALEFSIIYTHLGNHKRAQQCPAFN